MPEWDWKSVTTKVSVPPTALDRLYGSFLDSVQPFQKALNEEMTFSMELMMMTQQEAVIALLNRRGWVVTGERYGRNARLAEFAEGTDAFFWDHFPEFEFGADIEDKRQREREDW